PLLHGNVSAFITASMSCSRLLAKPLRGASDDPPARSSHDLRVSAFLSVRIPRKSCRSVYVSRAAGDASKDEFKATAFACPKLVRWTAEPPAEPLGSKAHVADDGLSSSTTSQRGDKVLDDGS